MEGGDEGAEADPLLDALAQAAYQLMAILNRLGAASDLSLTQLRVLAILRDRRVRMTALAEYLGLEKSTLTGLVGRGERRGLLQRVPGSRDKRIVEVALTAQGAELADRLYAEVAQQLRARTESLTATQRHELRVLLERVWAVG